MKISAFALSALCTSSASAAFSLRNDLIQAIQLLNLYDAPAAPVTQDHGNLDINLDALGADYGAYEVESNQEITIRARENPTTGFRWEVNSENCGVRVKLVDDTFIPPNDNLIGAGGERVFTFKTPDPAENYIRGLPCDLKFSHRRSWETGRNVADKTVRITVN